MTEIPEHLLERAKEAQSRMSRRTANLTVEQLKELRAMAYKTIEAHEMILDRLNQTSGHSRLSLEDCITIINQRIGELS